MNLAIMRKTFRDSWWLLLLVPLVIVGFEVLLVRACGELPADAVAWLERPFFQRFVRMLLGADLAASFTATGLITIGFAHPFMYAVAWALLLTICTRVTVGEIDRGTADLLLTLPLSRATLYTSTSIVWFLAALAASAAPLVGVWIGQALSPLWEPIELDKLRIPLVNLAALNLAVGGLTMAVGSALRRRGSAIGIVLAVLLASFLLNYLATLWPALERAAACGPLHYYKPLPAVRDGQWPLGDVLVLLSVAAVCWLLGLWRYHSRDIPAA